MIISAVEKMSTRQYAAAPTLSRICDALQISRLDKRVKFFAGVPYGEHRGCASPKLPA